MVVGVKDADFVGDWEAVNKKKSVIKTKTQEWIGNGGDGWDTGGKWGLCQGQN